MSPTRHGALAALALAACAHAHADRATMATPHHAAARQAIVSESRASRAACDALRGNAKAVCVAESAGRAKIALAELEARYRPSEKRRYEVYVAKAQAAHAVARARCDDLVWRAKDACTRKASESRAVTLATARRRLRAEVAARSAVTY